MKIDAMIFYDLVFAIFILGIGLVILAFFYASLFKRFRNLELEKDKQKKQVAFLLEDSKDKGLKIIEDAALKAREIMQKTYLDDDKSKNVLQEDLKNITDFQEQAFKKTSEDFLAAYQQLLGEVKKENIKTAQNISKAIESETESQIQDFKGILEKETLDSQRQVAAKIEEEYKQVEVEIKAYRQERLNAMQEDIFKILKEIIREVLGKDISIKEHEDMVMAALNKAKEEKFTN